MLTKNDLNQIGNVIDGKLKKSFGPIKKDVVQTRKDVKVLIAYFDREYLDLRKRIEDIEEHLGLTTKN